MANSNILKSYLVSLGFAIDESGQRKFEKGLESGKAKAAELATGLAELASIGVAAATALVAGITKISDSLEKLYFVSQRTKASAQNIQAFGFAAGQMGSSVEGATSSLENLARFMRTRPAGENYLQGLGVRTRQANGDLRDTTDILQDLGKKFAGMPQFRAQRLAEILGIDEKTMFALREGVGKFSSQYLAMLKAAGMDSQSAAKSSHELMNGLRTLVAMATILSNKVAAALGARLKKPLDDLQKWFLAKLPAIGKVVDSLADGFGVFVEGIVRFAQMVGTFVGSVIDWFRRLDPAAKQVIATAGALAAALWLLSSPLALIGAVAAAIFLLADDYQTWRRGGQSLINWSQWDDEIQKAIAGIQDVVAKVTDLITAIGKLGEKLYSFTAPQNILGTLPKEIGDLVDLLDALTSRDWGKIKIAARHIMADENFKGFTDDRMPRGIRNNNPGNIEYGDFARSQGATGAEAKGRFAVFPDAQSGLNATAVLLRKYAAQGIDTINSIIAKWAPPGENDTAAYAAGVAKRLGVSGTQHLNFNDPKIMEGLIGSITTIENGKNPYSREQVARAAGATTSTTDASKQIVLHQTNTTHIVGSSDPAAMAKQNDRSKTSNNEMLIRQLLPALQ